MKVAVVGSRSLKIENLEQYLPPKISELISGGAKGIDQCAKEYAISHQIKITEFLPNYSRYGRGAPIKRNIEILLYAEFVLVFWDGTSKGTSFMIQECKKRNLPHKIVLLK